jgi:hypothetical protein
MSHGQRLLSRFAAGLLASLLSGFLMNSQWGHASDPSAHPTPASLEMMQLLSDEHGLVADMVKAQPANERTELPRRSTVSSTDLDPASMAAAQSHGDRHAPTARSRRTS